MSYEVLSVFIINKFCSKTELLQFRDKAGKRFRHTFRTPYTDVIQFSCHGSKCHHNAMVIMAVYCLILPYRQTPPGP